MKRAHPAAAAGGCGRRELVRGQGARRWPSGEKVGIVSDMRSTRRESPGLAVVLLGVLAAVANGCGGGEAQSGADAGSGGSGSGGAVGTGGAGTGGGSGGMTAADAGPDLVEGGRPDAVPDTTGDVPSVPDATSDATTEAPASDAAPAYSPCPARGTACVIMPLGDSITQGFPNPAAGGYRAPLFHLARANMQTITFVGSGLDGPTMVDGVAFPRAHEGHSGFNIDATQGRMGVSQFFPGAITTYKPHLVLLMIGTNDVDTSTDNIPGRLATLMDTILNADPKLVLVVAQIVPQQRAMPDTLNLRVQAYNAALPALVKARADAGKHVLLIDMYGAFTAVPNFSMTLLADRLHPSPAGFQTMADTWYAAIKSLLR
jgi:hypothetical protein